MTSTHFGQAGCLGNEKHLLTGPKKSSIGYRGNEFCKNSSFGISERDEKLLALSGFLTLTCSGESPVVFGVMNFEMFEIWLCRSLEHAMHWPVLEAKCPSENHFLFHVKLPQAARGVRHTG